MVSGWPSESRTRGDLGEREGREEEGGGEGEGGEERWSGEEGGEEGEEAGEGIGRERMVAGRSPRETASKRTVGEVKRDRKGRATLKRELRRVKRRAPSKLFPPSSKKFKVTPTSSLLSFSMCNVSMKIFSKSASSALNGRAIEENLEGSGGEEIEEGMEGEEEVGTTKAFLSIFPLVPLGRVPMIYWLGCISE